MTEGTICSFWSQYFTLTSTDNLQSLCFFLKMWPHKFCRSSLLWFPSLPVKQQCFTSLSSFIPVNLPGHFLKAFNKDSVINSISQILQWNGGRLTSTWLPQSRPRMSPSSRNLFRVLKVLTVFAYSLRKFPYHKQWWSDASLKLFQLENKWIC